MKKLLIPTIVLTCALISLNPAAETVYKWTDGSGAVHFSDQPQNDAKAVDVQVSRKRSADSEEADTANAEGDEDAGAETKAQAGGGEKLDVAEQQKKIREQNCKIAQQSMQHNESIGRMYRVGADGERIMLSDEEREMVLKRSREDVAKWCD